MKAAVELDRDTAEELWIRSWADDQPNLHDPQACRYCELRYKCAMDAFDVYWRHLECGVPDAE